MAPTDPNVDAWFVIRAQQAQLEAQQLQHAKERDADRREIGRLVAMVEGLTRQLDALFGERDDQRRAELARVRAEAKTAAAAATAARAVEATTPAISTAAWRTRPTWTCST